MSTLIWNEEGTREYETGIKQCALYTGNTYEKAAAWQGITSVAENRSGAEESPFYADDVKYLSLRSAEEFGGTIEAYMYPKEWEECDGSKEIAPGIVAGQQNRKRFGLAYRTIVGNDTEHDDYGYKIHLVYGATASPTQKTYNTVNESPEPSTMSWEFTTVPVKVTGCKPTAILTINSKDFKTLKPLEDVLYGTEVLTPRLPLPDEVVTLLEGSHVEVVSAPAHAEAESKTKL